MSKAQIENIISPKIIRMGGGVVNEVGDICRQLGLYTPLVITDKTLVQLGHVNQLTEVLTKSNLEWSIFDKTIPEPSETCLNSALKIFKSGAYDCVIGFGGGSCLDIAKATSAMMVNIGRIRDYKHPQQINKTGVPIILIPTTGGTGSELTKWCVISDSKRHEKYNLSGLALVATAAIIDWKFSLTKPPRTTADTGIDSLTHAIEAFISKKSSNFSDDLALRAIPLITNNIEKAFKNPNDPIAREGLMRGASIAGMAFSNSSVALVHGMSRPIGANFHIAHGLSNAMLLVEVTNFSIEYARRRYAECAKVAGWANSNDSQSTACKKLLENLRRLEVNLNVPSLDRLGVNKSDYLKRLPAMAKQALQSGSPENNPRIPTLEDIITLYRAIW